MQVLSLTTQRYNGTPEGETVIIASVTFYADSRNHTIPLADVLDIAETLHVDSWAFGSEGILWLPDTEDEATDAIETAVHAAHAAIDAFRLSALHDARRIDRFHALREMERRIEALRVANNALWRFR